MKKIFFILSIGALMAVACNKNLEPVAPITQKVTLKAYTEPATKAALNSSNQVVWAAGDEIAVQLYKGTAYNGKDEGSGYDAWTSHWALNPEDAGKTQGSFSLDGLDEWVHWGYAAYYPIFDSNIGGDANIYFHLQKVYENYESGRMLLPLVANMNNAATGGLEGRPEEISFKHVGAGVKVTLKDIPASANQISLTVPGRTINGWFGVNPANAGTNDGIIVSGATEDTDLTSIYIKFATAESKRDMTFIFPLPTTDLPDGTSIKLYYGDSYTEFWSKKATGLPTLGRGDLLDVGEFTVPVDPAGDVTLYFRSDTPVTNSACFHCTTLGTTWPDDDQTGYDFPAYEIIAGAKYYKVTYPASQIWGKTLKLYFIDRYKWGSTGTEFSFSSKKMAYYFVATKDEPIVKLSGKPAEPSITIDGAFDDWANVGGSTKASDGGNISLLKAYSDGTSLYFYHKMTPGDGVTFDLSGWRYFRMYFDTDNNSETGWDTSHWLYAGADEIYYGENGAKHCLLVYHSKGGVANAEIEGTDGSYELKSIANDDGTIEVELKFALSELGTISGDEIKVFTSGSVASGQSTSGILSVVIPTA